VDEEAFWLRHLHLGLGLFALTVAGVTGYLAFGDPLRPGPMGVLGVLAAASMVIVALLPHRTIVRSRHRLRFFYAWSAFCVAFLLFATPVDGGGSSPIGLILVLPLVYGALAYPPRAVAALTTAAGGGYAVLAVAGPSTPTGTTILFTFVLLGTGLIAGAVAVMREASLVELLELQRRLEETARHDSLTGCLTHGAFHESLAAALARRRRNGADIAVLMLDLDDFKTVNDELGHLVGDDLLRTVGTVLQGSLRAGDAAGRVGGDEFAILLTDAPPDASRQAAERVIAALAEHGIAASVGLAAACDECDTTVLLARADQALYAAKRSGKARVAVA
jgi:diguanylate cyclase (GGDEF)-like protein